MGPVMARETLKANLLKVFNVEAEGPRAVGHAILVMWAMFAVLVLILLIPTISAALGVH
jgi:hypothetical protein